MLKSNTVLIGSRQKISNKALNVSIGGAALKKVSSIRYMGILIDSTLSYSLCMSIMLWPGSDLGSLLFIAMVDFHQLWFVYYIQLLHCLYNEVKIIKKATKYHRESSIAL